MGEQKHTKKTVPLFWEAQSNRLYTTYPGQVVRGCNFIRGIWMVDTLVYKIAGIPGASSLDIIDFANLQ